MKKLILYFTIIIFLSWVSFAWFCSSTSSSNPPKPPICSNSPDWLENYLESAVSMINSINTNKKISWPKWLWEQAWQTPVWTVQVSLFFSISWLWNFFQNFFIIFEDQHIVRDWIKLIDFKQYITNKFLKVSWNWILTTNIDNLSEIKTKITQWQYFLLKWNIKTYKDILKYIWENQLLIEKIYYEELVNWWIKNVNSKNNVIQDIINSIKENTKFTIDENKQKVFIEKLRKIYYENWKKIECSSTWTDFLKAIHNIVCNIWLDKVHESIQRFSCNYERLKYALNLWWSMWNCWSVRLKDWVSLKDRIKINWLWKAKQDLTEIWKIISDKIPSKIHEWLKDLFKEEEQIPINWKYKREHNIDNLKLDKLTDSLKKIDEIITNDKNSINSIITKVEPSTFTHNTSIMFPEISHKIYNIRKLLEINDNSIYKNTATACENQSPYGGKCRY